MYDKGHQHAQDNREGDSMMQHYREKTNIIEAVQFNVPEGPWPDGVGYDRQGCYVTNPNGLEYINKGDWIVKGASGALHVCPDKVFSSMYELVEVPSD